MRTISLLIIVLTTSSLLAQTRIDKTVAFQTGQKVKIRFDYPNLIKVSTWDKNEISIQGTVSINGGESDDAFKLQTKSDGDFVTIRNEISNMDNIPRRITVKRDGQKMVFRSKGEWKKYQEENGTGYTMMNEGVDMDITIDIKVPKNTETIVESVYGLVEVTDFTGPLTVAATYGGVDVSLAERTAGEVIAETNYGHIYSNLDVQLKSDRDENFHTLVSAKTGQGPRYSFESKYGNVYLRKGK